MINLDILLDNLRDWGIEHFHKNEDGTITVLQNVDWSERQLKELPDLNIKKIIGDFYINDNNLTSLKNCPKDIYGNFDCSNNNLKTLESGPESVEAYYFCDHNELNSLDNLPKNIKNRIFYHENLFNKSEENK